MGFYKHSELCIPYDLWLFAPLSLCTNIRFRANLGQGLVKFLVSEKYLSVTSQAYTFVLAGAESN